MKYLRPLRDIKDQILQLISSKTNNAGKNSLKMYNSVCIKFLILIIYPFNCILGGSKGQTKVITNLLSATQLVRR